MLGIILINYKNHIETINFVKNELVKITLPYKLLIVDNSGSKESSQTLISKLNAENCIRENINLNNSIFVIDAVENLGYARANNLGIKFLIKYFNPEFILLTNSDILIIDDDVVISLINKARELKEVVVIGPKIIGLDQKDQSPNKYISFFKRYILHFFLFPISFPLILKGYTDDIISNAKEGYYYRIIGSFCLINSDNFLQIGMFDEETFLYSEEKILAERLNINNLKMYYYPEKKVIHKGSEIVNKKYNPKEKWHQIFKSDFYYYHNYKKIPSFVLYFGKLSLLIYFNFYNPIVKSLKILIKYISSVKE